MQSNSDSNPAGFPERFQSLAMSLYRGFEDDLTRIANRILIPQGGELRILVAIARIHAIGFTWLATELEKDVNPGFFELLTVELKMLRRHANHKQVADDELVRTWVTSPGNPGSLVPLALLTKLRNVDSYFYRPAKYSYPLADPELADPLRALLILASCTWKGDLPHQPQEVLAGAILDVQPTRDSTKRLRSHPLGAWLEGVKRASHSLLDLINALSEDADLVRSVNGELASQLESYFIPLLQAMQAAGADESPAVQPDPDPVLEMPAHPATPYRRARTRTPRTTPGGTVRRKRIHIPGREPFLPAESPDEGTRPFVAVQRKQPAKTLLPLLEEIRWVRQVAWGNNTHLLRNHIESLSDAEAMAFARALDNTIAGNLQSGDIDQARTGFYVGLTLATGRVAGALYEMAHISEMQTGTSLKKAPLQLSVGDGTLRIRVARPESAFEPTKEQRTHLVQTHQHVVVDLPPSLIRFAQYMRQHGHSLSIPTDKSLFAQSLEEYAKAVGSVVGTGVGLSRVRLVSRARLREVTEDLASTMMLSGDTFGSSTAPLYYTCVRSEKLEQHFRGAIWPLFGDNPSKSHEERKSGWVGSHLLVSFDTARHMARCMGGAVHRPGKNRIDASTLIAEHNSLVNHCAGMLIVVGTHRPTNALFALTRFDLDVEGHGAIFSDKQSDPAHMHRFTPTASVLSEQMGKLTEHFRGLISLGSPRVPSGTLQELSNALTGKGPLLFHLDGDMQPVHLKIDTWRQTLPASWHLLPLNYGRTMIASRGRAAGIKPDHLAIVLGHLEAAGYPFSKDSPTEPATLSAAMSGPLDLVARNAGWICRNGLRESPTQDSLFRELGGLRDWKSELKSLADRSRAFEQEQRLVSRAFLREKKAAGEQCAMAALQSALGSNAQASSELALLLEAKEKGQPCHGVEKTPVIFDESVLEGVQDHIDADVGRDRTLQIAAHNALYRLLKRGVKRLGWKCPIPGPWLSPATLEPTPFFPGMMRARAHVNAMRARFSSISTRAPAESGFTAFEWACGTTVVALCLFGFVDQPDVLMDVLRARASGTRNSTIGDLLLIPLRENPRRVAGLRGLAAVAVARLMKKWPTDVLPAQERLNEIVAAQLPQEFVGEHAADVLVRLCATISVNNLLELSGLARMALSPETGSVSLQMDRQRQLLEEDLSSVSAPESNDANLPAAPAATTIAQAKRGKSLAMSQYYALRSTLNVGSGPKELRLTNAVISASNITAFRQPLMRELEAFLAMEKLSPVVSCLAAFALDLTRHGTPQESEPAWSTVHKYITSFGSALVDIAGDLSFSDLEEDDYSDIYQDLLERIQPRNRWLAARELANFHRYLTTHHGFDAIDLSDLDASTGAPERLVDAEVIQSGEYIRANALIVRAASLAGGVADSVDPEQRRLQRQAQVLTPLLRYSGGRINEVAGLRFKDIYATNDHTLLFIRPSRYRRLKTAAARRMVDLGHWLTDAERHLIVMWLDAERARLMTKWKATLPIFGLLASEKQRVPSADLRETILQALLESTGSRTRLHRFRHLVANERLLRLLLSLSDWQAWQQAMTRHDRHSDDEEPPAIVLPRDLRAFTTEIGHHDASTSIQSYFHLPWACSSRAAAGLRKYADRHSGAVALGLSAAGADKIVQRAKSHTDWRSNDPCIAWLDHLLDRPELSPARSVESESELSTASVVPLTARFIEQVLRNIQQGVDPVQATRAYGLKSAHTVLLRGLALEVEHRTGFVIWPGTKPGIRTARSLQSGKGLMQILDFLDRQNGDAERELAVELATIYFTHATKGKPDRLCWPRRHLGQLSRLVRACGVADEQIRWEVVNEPMDIVSINVRRNPTSRQSLNRTVAWLLMMAYVSAEFRALTVQSR